jgi:glycosyltransferase involved in cell wall biosynthesis
MLTLTNARHCIALQVPTLFHVNTFATAGVRRSKLFVLGEPVDTEFFNPTAVQTPTKLPMGRLLTFVNGADSIASNTKDKPMGRPFRFISIFKFEDRKGWDVLLSAFIDVFAKELITPDGSSSSNSGGGGDEGGSGGGGDDDDRDDGGADGKQQQETPKPQTVAELYLLTNTFHTDFELADRVQAYVQAKLETLEASAAAEGGERFKMNGGGGRKRQFQAPAIYVIDTHVPQRELPGLYAAADCFVLPSRGEGWGRSVIALVDMMLAFSLVCWHW